MSLNHEDQTTRTLTQNNTLEKSDDQTGEQENKTDTSKYETEDSRKLSSVSAKMMKHHKKKLKPELKKKLTVFPDVPCPGNIEKYMEEQLIRIGTPYKKTQSEDSVDAKSQNLHKAQQYLKTHYIFELFHFMICHLLVNAPKNPVYFLIDLLERSLFFRGHINNPTLLFEEKHIESLFKTMDPMQLGVITKSQYEIGMKTLGIACYNQDPLVDQVGMVSMYTFCNEAKSRLVFQLTEMLEPRDVAVIPKNLTIYGKIETDTKCTCGCDEDPCQSNINI